jgi:hypothetical protein
MGGDRRSWSNNQPLAPVWGGNRRSWSNNQPLAPFWDEDRRSWSNHQPLAPVHGGIDEAGQIINRWLLP